MSVRRRAAPPRRAPLSLGTRSEAGRPSPVFSRGDPGRRRRISSLAAIGRPAGRPSLDGLRRRGRRRFRLSAARSGSKPNQLVGFRPQSGSSPFHGVGPLCANVSHCATGLPSGPNPTRFGMLFSSCVIQLTARRLSACKQHSFSVYLLIKGMGCTVARLSFPFEQQVKFWSQMQKAGMARPSAGSAPRRNRSCRTTLVS